MKTAKIFLLVAYGICFASFLSFAGFFFMGTPWPLTWTLTSAPNDVWISIASSADGKKLVAATTSAIYTSANSGTTWQRTTAPSKFWISVASSADGTQLAAAGNSQTGSPILISTNSGAMWKTSSAPFLAWNSIASSSDGSKLAAVYFGGLYTSADSGATWVKQTNAPVAQLMSIASSADGNKLVTCEYTGGLIFHSADGGMTWTSNSVSGTYFESVASSADGNTLVAVGGYSPIYVSTNSGATWQLSLNISVGGLNPEWRSVACSADGKRMIAACNTRFLYNYYVTAVASPNAGAWWAVINQTNCEWSTVVSSADGGEFVLAGNSTGIDTLRPISKPRLNLWSVGNSSTVSWIVPSTNFVLQQSADLSSWTDLTNQPVLNLTNLQNEVILPSSGGNGFFRLKSP